MGTKLALDFRSSDFDGITSAQLVGPLNLLLLLLACEPLISDRDQHRDSGVIGFYRMHGKQDIGAVEPACPVPLHNPRTYICFPFHRIAVIPWIKAFEN